MRTLLQRVKRASVTVDGKITGEISDGLLVLTGLAPDDTEAVLRPMAKKIAELRIFEDSAGKMNLSLLDTSKQVLAVSQFTLYADASKGRRPSFIRAMPGDAARPLFDKFCEALRVEGLQVATGIFGAMMDVELINAGPVTIWLDSDAEWR